ncbi:LysR substrate-binding domain-containing protein [Aquabacterium sp. J223]|uniref:LysR substrate-binding domain-containing protein n=1 Tax=Aquabacterium sp. J223 TaxID=2898431 RepID=UPI0021ADDA81|nr:LysR substrate-binding domain-containing protein [Aquabacterium sp. J223]UUX95198.1 LysR substrate-binding domain-containing protein [Aquabacterium sp. J223]
MELRQLRYFIGVAEAGSLLKASARLHVAQPALGQQIAALEDEVGARLFERTSRGMALTDAGRTFLDHAKVVLADVERARAAVSASAGEPRGEVVIGLPTTAALAATVPIVRACRERLPQVRLKVIEGYSGFVREWLTAGRLDLAILYGDAPVATLALQPLVEERLALITAAAESHRPGPIALVDVARHPLVLPGREHGLRRIVDDACAAAGLTLDVVAEIDSLPNVKRVVEAGIGRTILPAGAVAEEVAAGRLTASTITDASMLRRVMLARSVARPASLAATAVAALTVDLIRGMVAAGAWPGRWIGD